MAEEHAGEKKPHKKKHKSHGGGHGGGHHEEGVPEWMVSFADNVCLMMGFFVIMLALNMAKKDGGAGESTRDGATNPLSEPNPALVDAAIAIREAFNNPVRMDSANPNDQPLIRRIKEKTSAGRSRDKAPEGDKDSVQSIRASDFYSPAGSVPFNDGSADLTPASRRLAGQIAEAVRGPNFVIEIRGYVSAMEAQKGVNTARDLSYRRALAVAEVLADLKIPWERMRIIACGDNDRQTPIAYDLKAHRTNQRVEAFVTKEVIQRDPHLRDQAPAAEAAHPAAQQP